MHYIVGLGNKGDEYQNTRHNVGFLALDACIQHWGLPPVSFSSFHKARVTSGAVAKKPVSIQYPETFMNASGSAVSTSVPKEESAQLIVLYDDIDIALGEVKVSFGRGDGGHNGVASIIASLGTKDFVRIRIGIAPKSFWTGATVRPQGAKLAPYVLGKFTKRELTTVGEVSSTVREIIETILVDGKEVAMNKFN